MVTVLMVVVAITTVRSGDGDDNENRTIGQELW